MKFRVGDRVRILSTLTSRDLGDIGIDENIDEYVGKVDKVEYDDGKYYLNEKENIVDSFHHYKDWYIVYTSLDGGNLIYKGAPSLDNSFIDTTGGAYGPEDTKKSIYKQLKRGKTKDIPEELAKCYASIYGN